MGCFCEKNCLSYTFKGSSFVTAFSRSATDAWSNKALTFSDRLSTFEPFWQSQKNWSRFRYAFALFGDVLKIEYWKKQPIMMRKNTKLTLRHIIGKKYTDKANDSKDSIREFFELPDELGLLCLPVLQETRQKATARFLWLVISFSSFFL